jgi:hypothetical protein
LWIPIDAHAEFASGADRIGMSSVIVAMIRLKRRGWKALSIYRAMLRRFLQRVDVAAANYFHIARDLLRVPIPLANEQQSLDRLLVESISNHCRWIAADDRIRWHIFGDDRLCRNDRAIADFDAGHERRRVTDPHIVADEVGC